MFPPHNSFVQKRKKSRKIKKNNIFPSLLKYLKTKTVMKNTVILYNSTEHYVCYYTTCYTHIMYTNKFADRIEK